MTATIVEVTKVIDHPNADSLTIYEVSNNLDIEKVQVVANNENKYETGDKAVYIQPGSILQDGTKISNRKLRGVSSFGMLAGPSDLLVGADVTGHWCQLEPELPEIKRTNLKHQKWPSIESLAHVKRTVRAFIKDDKMAHQFHMTYGGKVKLHGTNAGVQISPEGEVVAQKRSSVIYPDQDNVGFASWVYKNIEAFKEVASEYNMTIHGEWFGPKIQKEVACSNIPEKNFAVFALQFKDLSTGKAEYIVEPSEIKRIIGDGPWLILPWHCEFYLNFYDELQIQTAAAHITNEVLKIEECDPFIKETFGVEGIGEGLVFYPKFDFPACSYTHTLEPFMFKAKGTKHQANANKNREVVPINIEKLNSVQEFISKFITESRLEQGVVEACNGQYETKLIGTFLKWIGNDIKKESVAEIEDSNIEWKDVAKPLATKARIWYQSKIC